MLTKISDKPSSITYRLEKPEASECQHFWIIECQVPGEPYSQGECKYCKETRQFSNWLPQDFIDAAVNKGRYVPEFITRMRMRRRHRSLKKKVSIP